jgi:GT2 family glycosyltransferase
MNDSLPIKVQLKNDFIIGIAIATYNSDKVIRRCLNSFKDQKFKVVIFDDASTDKTLEIASSVIPNLIVLNGDGSAWWGGGTARAVDKCFSIGCEFVLMLNPDAIISAEDINKMVEYTFNKSHLITAGLVVRDDDIKKLCWGGSRRINLPGFAMHINKYIYKKNFNVQDIGQQPYETHEVHGRGVLISRSVYKMIGTLDWKEFPHYGADNDYSLRAKSAGIKLMILPAVKVRLVASSSGMKLQSKPFSIPRLCEVYKFLTNRKNGEFIYVLWRLTRRHTPLIAIIPSFLINLIYIIFRKLSQNRLLI